MANIREPGTSTQFRVPRAMTTPTLQPELEEVTQPAEIEALRKKQKRWTEEMDEILVITLLEQVLVGRHRVDNGFTSSQLAPVAAKVLEVCLVSVNEKNIRSRLKTLKKEYLEFHELIKVSGFGWSPTTGRITAEPSVWEKYAKENPDGKSEKLKGKVCAHYDSLGIIFGNDTATGDRSVSGNDFPRKSVSCQEVPMDDIQAKENEVEEKTEPQMLDSPSVTSKRALREDGLKARRRQKYNVDEAAQALAVIAESSKKIAGAFELQATQTHVNWGNILGKLQGMNIEQDDILMLMQVFEKDKDLGRIFIGLDDRDFSRAWVYNKLGRTPPY